jgi:hypothetical protein
LKVVDFDKKRHQCKDLIKIGGKKLMIAIIQFFLEKGGNFGLPKN